MALSLSDRPVAGRYARALFEASQAHKATDRVRKDLGRLAALLIGKPAWAAGLKNPRVSPAQKMAALSKELGALPPLLENFLRLLLTRKRWDVLPLVRPLFEGMANRAAKVLAVRVTSARPLTGEQTRALVKNMSRAWGGDVALEPAVDEALLGGVVLRVGDCLWDYSLRGRLEQLRENLLASASQ